MGLAGTGSVRAASAWSASLLNMERNHRDRRERHLRYNEDFDRARVVAVAENARRAFEGMPGLRSKVFTVDDVHRRAMNFYVWDSTDAAKSFFSHEMRQRVTGLYGVAPTIDFVEIAQIVDNSHVQPKT
jgi:heme-degrading monooxygenase HmoA